MKSKIELFLAIPITVLIIGLASAAEITVPGDFSTLGEAVNAASTGDTITISGGEYIDPFPIVINKDLIITGAGKGVTFLKKSFPTGGSGDARAWILVDPGVTVTFSGFTMDGEGDMRTVWTDIWNEIDATSYTHQAIRWKGSGSISDCEIKNIRYGANDGTGVAAFGGWYGSPENVDVTNCDFSSINRIYVGYWYDGTTGTVRGSTFVGLGPTDWSLIPQVVYNGWFGYAIEPSSGAVVNIFDNDISGFSGEYKGGTGLWTSGGIFLTTAFGSGTYAIQTGNNLYANAIAIIVGSELSADPIIAAINENNIYDNDIGLDVGASVHDVDATCDWWGAPNGPSGVNPGSGDVVTDFAAYEPWLLDPAPGGLCGGYAVFAECFENPRNHGQFVSCIAHAVNDLRKSGAINRQKARDIKRWAALAYIP